MPDSPGPGTPDVLGVIRAGLVFQLKAAIGCTEIRAREQAMTERFMSQLKAVPGIKLLGNTTADRLPIVTFMVKFKGAAAAILLNYYYLGTCCQLYVSTILLFWGATPHAPWDVLY